MTKKFSVAMVLLCAVCALQSGQAQDKAAAHGTLKVKIHYKGSGSVDEQHKILVFLFDTPTFLHGGGAIPFAMMSLNSADGAVTFSDVAKSPVYVSTVYDPKGAYDGQAAPPAGSSLGIYSKEPGEPVPLNVEPGKTASVELTFDDAVKMH